MTTYTQEQKFDLCQQWVNATLSGTAADKLMTSALNMYGNTETAFICTTTPFQALADQLLVGIIGNDVFGWLCWYVWDADFGEKELKYTIADVEYDVSKQTFEEFFVVISDDK